MRVLTPEDLTSLIGKKVKIHSDYDERLSEVKVKRVSTASYYKDAWTVLTEPPVKWTGGVVIDSSGYGINTRKPVFVDGLTNLVNSDNFCSCPNPRLVINSVLGKEFYFCRNCKKERERI